MKLSRKNQARLAWVKSFFRLHWRFEDYPLDYVDQGECPRNLPESLQHKRWRADLINWHHMSGTGESEEAALTDLRQKFAARLESGEKMLRPGTKSKIEFASNEVISRYPELRDDFIQKVLGLEWAWVSDESSLWDFHADEDNRKMYLKIGEVYGVDVSHITSGNLAEIFDEIMRQTGTFPEDPTVKAVRLTREARDRHIAGLSPLPWNSDSES